MNASVLGKSPMCFDPPIHPGLLLLRRLPLFILPGSQLRGLYKNWFCADHHEKKGNSCLCTRINTLNFVTISQTAVRLGWLVLRLCMSVYMICACMCIVMLLASVMQQLWAQDKFPCKTMKYILSYSQVLRGENLLDVLVAVCCSCVSQLENTACIMMYITMKRVTCIIFLCSWLDLLSMK